LQLQGGFGFNSHVVCFNPYRVFEYVATVSKKDTKENWDSVSIPIGFSSTLQRNAATAQ